MKNDIGYESATKPFSWKLHGITLLDSILNKKETSVKNKIIILTIFAEMTRNTTVATSFVNEALKLYPQIDN